jgi:hypothetical protein
MEPEIDIYRYIIDHASPTHNSIANIVHKAYQKEYRVHLLGRNNKVVQWFRLERDGSSSPIDDIVIKRRLSTEIADLVSEARMRFKSNPEYNKMEALATNNKSIEALNATLRSLIEKKTELREVNNIDDARIVETKIKDTEAAIELITKRQDMMRADVKDAKFKNLVIIEDKLYNSNFKDRVMKQLVELFYEPLVN